MGTVLVVNPHGAGGSRDKEFARWYNEMDPNIGFVSEMGENDLELRKTHRVFTGRGSRGLEDTAVVLRKGAKITSDRMVKVTRDFHRPVAPDRWVSRVRQPNKQLLSVHANAVIQDPKTGGYRSNPWARDWYRAMREINRMIRWCDTPTLLGGDLNWRHVDRMYGRSPEWLAHVNDMDYTYAQVMWLMWDDKTWNMTDRMVIDGDSIPVGVNEENPHPALFVELKRRPL